MVVKFSIRAIAGSADTAEHGALVFEALSQALKSDGEIVVSFKGVQTATSSFTNIAFVKMLSAWPLAEIKRRVRIVESTRQINEMIKSRLDRESSHTFAA
jgi:uncharacterized protein DUF4325